MARGRWGGRASGGKEACSGFKATEGAGEGPKVNGDEADEDIHARYMVIGYYRGWESGCTCTGTCLVLRVFVAFKYWDSGVSRA